MSPKSIIYGLLGLAIIGALSWTVHELREGARQEAISDVEKANRANDGKAAKGQAAVDECYRRGGTWDRTRGLCSQSNAAGK
ncbi:hypothetical protein KXR64_16690 [Brucella intermedia]|uniref:hypothetical protein n=1 Tax=Brucella TaxID=234 RepID=UPI0011152858|nr:hypothetical protein [Brucella intermedia]